MLNSAPHEFPPDLFYGALFALAVLGLLADLYETARYPESTGRPDPAQRGTRVLRRGDEAATRRGHRLRDRARYPAHQLFRLFGPDGRALAGNLADGRRTCSRYAVPCATGCRRQPVPDVHVPCCSCFSTMATCWWSRVTWRCSRNPPVAAAWLPAYRRNPRARHPRRRLHQPAGGPSHPPDRSCGAARRRRRLRERLRSVEQPGTRRARAHRQHDA